MYVHIYVYVCVGHLIIGLAERSQLTVATQLERWGWPGTYEFCIKVLAHESSVSSFSNFEP